MYKPRDRIAGGSGTVTSKTFMVISNGKSFPQSSLNFDYSKSFLYRFAACNAQTALTLFISSYLNESQDPTDSEHSHHPQQRGRNGQIYHYVFHKYAENGGENEQEIEDIPGNGEVMVSQTYRNETCLVESL